MPILPFFHHIISVVKSFSEPHFICNVRERSQMSKNTWYLYAYVNRMFLYRLCFPMRKTRFGRQSDGYGWFSQSVHPQINASLLCHFICIHTLNLNVINTSSPSVGIYFMNNYNVMNNIFHSFIIYIQITFVSKKTFSLCFKWFFARYNSIWI